MDIDAKVKELLEVVSKKRSEIEKQETVVRSKWLTNCSFPFNDGRHPNRNLQTASFEQIVEVSEAIAQKILVADKALHLLDMPVPAKPVTIGAFTVNEWLIDCKKRLAAISLNEEKRKLEDLESKLNTLVSPEQRRAMELEQVMKALGQ